MDLQDVILGHYWYSGGLNFECTGCGNCCAGPEEGYIWISKPEIEFLAEHLGTTVEAVRQKYLKRYGLRHSIIEDGKTNDCIFLTGQCSGGRGCAVYPVRPNQCRTWPFWDTNLSSPDAWNWAATRCPGINRGRRYPFEEIEAIKKQRQWWEKK
jgi:Fe-S-cluster containining protein